MTSEKALPHKTNIGAGGFVEVTSAIRKTAIKNKRVLLY